MTASRLQHIVPGAAILLLAVVVAWLSFTQEPAESFLFPRVISIAFVVLAIWNFIRAVLGLAKVGGGISKTMATNILPGFIVMVVYVFWAAKAVGFYSASAIAFFLVYSLYDPAPASSMQHWLKRLGVTVGFMLVIYALFNLLLRVQTPRGLFF